MWADIAIVNTDNVPGLEVVVAWSGGFVGIFDLATGAAKHNSPVKIAAVSNEFRGMAVADMVRLGSFFFLGLFKRFANALTVRITTAWSKLV